MERIHREQPKVEDVQFITLAEQLGTEYRGFEGGAVGAHNLPVDTMEGLMVSKEIPEGYFAEGFARTAEDIVKGGKVVLGDDMAVPTCLVIKDGIASEVNLNGKKIVGGIFSENKGTITEGNTDSYVFYVQKDGNLTINGEGVVESQEAEYSMAVWAKGGKVTINGGLFKNAGNGCDLIYASDGGEIVINGGEFMATENKGADAAKNKYNVLNLKDNTGASIIVRGGKFHGFDPANNVSENPAVSFVADGYKSVEVSEGVWEVMPA